MNLKEDRVPMKMEQYNQLYLQVQLIEYANVAVKMFHHPLKKLFSKAIAGNNQQYLKK